MEHGSADEAARAESVTAEFDVDQFHKIVHLKDLAGTHSATQLSQDFEIRTLFNTTMNKAIEPRASELLAAVQSRNAEKAITLIEDGVPVDTAMADGATLLHIASQVRTPDVTKVLLDAKANPDKVDDLGWTPLLTAALQSDVDTVQHLN